MKKQEPKQSIALQRLSKSFIERLYEDGKIQEAFMAEHINQLYDYLSDKEEASNGECLECHRTSKVVDLDKGCPFCGTDKEDFITHSPQQEESRGECDCVDGYRKYFPRLKGYKCPHKHQLKEESPKEDGGVLTEKITDILNLDESNLSKRDLILVVVGKLIKANFVSKSKLSKYVQDGIDECNEPGMRIGGVAVLREMQMALGLEEL